MTSFCHLCFDSGVTNKLEWDKFMRQSSGRKFPIALSDYLQSNKVDLFNFWLDADQDWKKTELKVQRSVENENVATKGWEAVQGKILRQKFTEDKFNTLIASRKSAGLWYEDEDFPGDMDES